MSPTQTTRRPWKSTFWSRWTNSLPLPYTSVPHAHIYIRKLFPKKSIHTFTGGPFSCGFHQETVWRFSLSTLHTLHRTWRSARAGVKAWEAVWRLEIPNPSQLEAMKISRKRTFCERVNSFFGNKLRIYTRVKERNNETFTDTVKQIPWHPHSLNHILPPESCTDAAVQEPHSGRIHGSVTLHEQVQDYFLLLGD